LAITPGNIPSKALYQPLPYLAKIVSLLGGLSPLVPIADSSMQNLGADPAVTVVSPIDLATLQKLLLTFTHISA